MEGERRIGLYMRELVLQNLSEEALCATATRLVRLVFPGAFLAMYGDLGAGKDYVYPFAGRVSGHL